MTAGTGVRRPLPPLRPLPARAPGIPATPTDADNATVVGREDLTRSVTRFRIRPDLPPPHIEPGQYLTLGLIVDGRIVQRPYSTATRAGTHEELEFLVRLVPGGMFTPLLWTLGLGDRLRIGRPKGLFNRIPGDDRTHLFIATGTGLAPFIGMIDTFVGEPGAPRAVVIHGVSHVAELAYRERLERWASEAPIRYVPSISRPNDPSNAGWSGWTGRLDAILGDVCTTIRLEPRDTIAYLCGNPEMIAAGERILADLGLLDDAIRSEHYWPG
jgi:ferredoxin-NADP reductase